MNDKCCLNNSRVCRFPAGLIYGNRHSMLITEMEDALTSIVCVSFHMQTPHSNSFISVISISIPVLIKRNAFSRFVLLLFRVAGLDNGSSLISKIPYSLIHFITYRALYAMPVVEILLLLLWL